MALIAGGIVLALLAAAAVIAVTGVLDSSSEDTSTELKSRFDGAMRYRSDFFRIEREYLSGMGRADEKLSEYQRKDRSATARNKRLNEEFADEFDRCVRVDVACPEPNYSEAPEAPRLRKETAKIRSAANDLDELAVRLVDVTPRPELVPLFSQLEKAIEALKQEAEHNADVLDEAIDYAVGEDAIDQVDKGKLKTIRRRSALPAIKAMNGSAVRLVKSLSLSMGDYDVPGGQDVDPEDHSTNL
jgi:hypothetical protein